MKKGEVEWVVQAGEGKAKVSLNCGFTLPKAVLSHTDSVSFQTGSEEGQKATVTGSSMRKKRSFSMRVVKYCCRLHTCAVPDLRDSHNSVGKNTQQVNLTQILPSSEQELGLDYFRAPLQPYFCMIPLENAFYTGKKQSPGICQSRLLCCVHMYGMQVCMLSRMRQRESTGKHSVANIYS